MAPESLRPYEAAESLWRRQVLVCLCRGAAVLGAVGRAGVLPAMAQSPGTVPATTLVRAWQDLLDSLTPGQVDQARRPPGLHLPTVPGRVRHRAVTLMSRVLSRQVGERLDLAAAGLSLDLSLSPSGGRLTVTAPGDQRIQIVLRPAAPALDHLDLSAPALSLPHRPDGLPGHWLQPLADTALSLKDALPNQSGRTEGAAVAVNTLPDYLQFTVGQILLWVEKCATIAIAPLERLATTSAPLLLQIAADRPATAVELRLRQASTSLHVSAPARPSPTPARLLISGGDPV